MIGLSHIVMQVGLCNPIVRAAADASVAVRVRMVGHLGDVEADQTFNFARGAANAQSFDINVAPGIYRVLIQSPIFGCSAADFLDVLPGQNRNVVETLTDGTQPAPATLLISGETVDMSAPPQVVAIPANTTCAGFVEPVATNETVENERGAYYDTFHEDPALTAHGPVTLALRIPSVTGTSRFVSLAKLNVVFPAPFTGFPQVVQFDVTESLVDGVSDDPPGILLCPPIYKASVKT